ncbi:MULTISPECIES: hypothetical protein [unclassified Mammaliicoccus]|uniref:hypothetical protein n=1 Tax=unclassified Mammaliicoccus TaxID=2803851 RepID=UPI001EFB0427|nr:MULTISPECIES: hypothetical protein [unclassified Mammaliicoccus]
MIDTYFNELSDQEKYVYLYGRSSYEVEICRWLSDKTSEVTEKLNKGVSSEYLLNDFLTGLADKIRLEAWEGQIQKKQLTEAE